MKLTGKAKELFEKWFNTHHVYEHLCLATFQELPASMQYGVYQDWADSLGIRLDVTVCYDNMLHYIRGFEVKVNEEELFQSNDVFETRQEARNAAIDKLNELINQNK